MQSRMSLWLEIISAVAVVVSLVFVGFEIRNSTEQTEQNTRALQVSAYQDLINRIVDMNAIDSMGLPPDRLVDTIVDENIGQVPGRAFADRSQPSHMHEE